MQQVYQQQLQLQQLQLQSNIEQISSSHRELSIGMSSNGVLPNDKNDRNSSQLSDALGHSALSSSSVLSAEAQETRLLEPQDEPTSKENGLLMLHNEIDPSKHSYLSLLLLLIHSLKRSEIPAHFCVCRYLRS